MSPIDDLPPLRDVIARHGLAAKKALGQNFLLDFNITAKIARAAGPLDGSTVFEIGPGPGGLTRALLAQGAGHVVAIERDQRCLPALEEISAAYPGRLIIIEGDALTVDYCALARDAVSRHGGDVRICANLPYNVATPLLTGWLSAEPWPPFWSGMVLMFQKEVAQRIVARPGDKAYGRLGVLANWLTHAEIAFDLPPQAFSPPPKVTSSVVLFQPRQKLLPALQSAIETVTRHAFGQRRKMLRQSLKPLGGEDLIGRAGLKPTARAEEIGIEGYVALANALRASP